MTKSEIIDELESIKERLASIEWEAKISLTGYCSSAVEIAGLAVSHAVDLATLASESNHVDSR